MDNSTHIEGLGPSNVPVKLVTGVDWSQVSLTAQDGFLLSRIDGIVDITKLCLISGLGKPETIDGLKRLCAKGLITIGDPPPPTAKHSGKKAQSGENVKTHDPLVLLTVKAGLQPDNSPTDEPVDLSPDQRARLKAVHTLLANLNYFDMLGVSFDADMREIRRAYFARSKEFHPDRYFTKQLGPFKTVVTEIFKQMAAAYQFLEVDEQREIYRQTIRQQLHLTGSRPVIQPIGARSTPAPSAEFYSIDTQSRTAPRPVVNASFSPPAPSVPAVAVSAVPTQPPMSEPPRGPAESPPIPTERALRRDEDVQRRRRLTNGTFSMARRQRADTYYKNGVKQAEEGKWLAAVASFKLAISIDDSEPEYHKRYQEAVEKSQSQTAEGYYKRGLGEESMGRMDSAIPLFIRAAEVHAVMPYVFKGAQACLRSNDLKRAKDFAQKSVELEPQNAAVHLLLAQIYWTAGLAKNATREAEIVLELDAANTTAKQLLKEIRRA